jgi:DNA-binding IscR family transcriptional regulator
MGMVVENKILGILENHQGADNAITYKDIATQLGVSRRTVRLIVKKLIESDMVPIGSISDGSGGGYFLISSEEERKRAVAELNARIHSLSMRALALESAPL